MSILLNKIDKLIELGRTCVIHRAGVSNGWVCRIDARDDDFIQYTALNANDTNEIYSQGIMKIEYITAIDFFIRNYLDHSYSNEKHNSLKNI